MECEKPALAPHFDQDLGSPGAAEWRLIGRVKLLIEERGSLLAGSLSTSYWCQMTDTPDEEIRADEFVIPLVPFATLSVSGLAVS